MIIISASDLRERVSEILCAADCPDPVSKRVAESLDESRLLREAIRKLDSARQQLLVLKFTQGLSNTEIGNVMGRSEGAIKSLYHRTLLQLRKEVSKRGTSVE